MRASCAMATLAIVAACGPARPQPGRLASSRVCEYVVRNATAMALEVRRFEAHRLTGVGTLNPGEQLTESAACAEGRVYVLGIPLPPQAGAPSGKPVFGFVDLDPATRAQLTLYWP